MSFAAALEGPLGDARTMLPRRDKRSLVMLAWLVSVPLLGGVAAAASTYQVNIESDLQGLDIKVSTVENPGGIIVRLQNDSATKVRCNLRYDAAPQPIGRRTVYVGAGKTGESVFGAKRQWSRVDIKVDCEAAK